MTIVSLRSVAALVAASTLAGCASMRTAGATLRATADLREASGRAVGTATFTQADAGGPVTLRVETAGLAAGSHGIHVHAVGSCDASGTTAFGAAGGHFNPTTKQHGLENPAGPHGGDLPNLVVDANGSGRLETTTDRLTLVAGQPLSVLDADGAALVIHAGPDDQRTDPAGNSGGRIVCGVIRKG